MNKMAIIDIDNTLWQFCDAFYEELREINKGFPARANWTHLDIWAGYCSEQDFYEAVNAIHQRQDCPGIFSAILNSPDNTQIQEIQQDMEYD